MTISVFPICNSCGFILPTNETMFMGMMICNCHEVKTDDPLEYALQQVEKMQ